MNRANIGWIFAATAAFALICASGTFAQEKVTVTGTLTDSGVECPAMQRDDGELYTLVPRDAVGLQASGRRIRVSGTVQEVSICQQGVTLAVDEVASAE
jgi:hypothetical protein